MEPVSRKIKRLPLHFIRGRRPASSFPASLRAFMPLTEPTPHRQRLHSRHVTYEGFQREDGLFDIEGRLVDVKDTDTMLLSGVRAAGEAIHDGVLPATLALAAAPFAYYRARSRTLRAQRRRAWPDAIEPLAGAVRTGDTLPAALAVIACRACSRLRWLGAAKISGVAESSIA